MADEDEDEDEYDEEKEYAFDVMARRLAQTNKELAEQEQRAASQQSNDTPMSMGPPEDEDKDKEYAFDVMVRRLAQTNKELAEQEQRSASQQSYDTPMSMGPPAVSGSPPSTRPPAPMDAGVSGESPSIAPPGATMKCEALSLDEKEAVAALLHLPLRQPFRKITDDFISVSRRRAIKCSSRLKKKIELENAYWHTTELGHQIAAVREATWRYLHVK